MEKVAAREDASTVSRLQESCVFNELKWILCKHSVETLHCLFYHE